MVLYHGSRCGTITAFNLQALKHGELSRPVNCIWLTDSFEAAKYHVTNVLGGPGFVYEVQIAPGAVIVDATDPNSLDKKSSKKIIKKHISWFGRIVRTHSWLSSISQTSEKLGDFDSKNLLFKTLRDEGVDILANPLVQGEWVNKKFEIRHYSNTGGGTAYALLNEKVVTLMLPPTAV